MNTGNARGDAIKADGDAARVRSDFHKTHPNVPVLVGGDKEVKYDAIIQLMASLKDAGVESVGLMTQPSSEQKK